MDNDNDIDLVSYSIYFNNPSIIWHENTDGQGNFSAIEIDYNISFSQTPRSMDVNDIDNDGDLDILISSRYYDTLFWYENLDGIGDFNSEPHVITENVDGAYYAIAADFDGDQDNDILFSSNEDKNILAWYENKGLFTNRIQGTLTFDENNNGCDGNDFLIQNARVQTTNGSETIETFTYSNGTYQLFPAGEGEYTTEVTSISNYFTIDPNQYVDNFTGLNNTIIGDFCVTANNNINDLNITFLPTVSARPGFVTSYVATFHNVGTTVLSGSVVIDFSDSQLDFYVSDVPVTSQTGNSLTFDYLDFQPFETRMINISFQVLPPPIVEIGEVLSFTATVNPVVDDETEEDNIFVLDQTVIGSYDPNDITVIEGNSIYIDDVDQFLHYVIRFQNTGTASAVNIVVDNILDANLDWSTLALEGISHPYTVEIRNGNNVSFVFDNIYLPDSTTNEAESHGYISYKIKPIQSIEVGHIMSNTADIFFDFNPAIQTNTVITEVIETLGDEDISAFVFTIYPVPSTNFITISTQSALSKVEIYSYQGVKVHQSTSETKIDISALSTGLYFIRIVDSEGNEGIKKIIKK
jgi:uncharacterized repeat protein (TIGR01451 family)